MSKADNLNGPEVDSASNRNEYQEFFQGGKGGRCVRLTTLTPSCAVVTKFGNLNFWETSGPLQARNGTVLPFYILRTLYKERNTVQAIPVSYQCVYRFSIVVLLLEYEKPRYVYRGADKSVARPGRKQVNVSVKMA